jgi:hypothetical protein
LAKIAGEGEKRKTGFQQDLALIQLGLQQQSLQQEAEARDQAFALQTAMAARVANTPTARAATAPRLDTSLARFGMEQGIKEQTRNEQLTELNNAFQLGTIDERVYELNRLRIMGGQAVEFPTPATEKLPPVSVRTARYQTQLDRLQEEYKVASGWAQDPTAEHDVVTRAKAEQTRIKSEIDKVIAQQESAFGITSPAGTAAPTEDEVPPAAGQWEGQKARDKASGTTWTWTGGKWVKA